MAFIAPGGPSSSGDVPREFERKPRRMPVVLLGLIVLGAFVAIGFTMFKQSVVYYKTPTEVLSMRGVRVRVSGAVVNGSIHSDVTTGTVSFDVTDGVTTVPIVFDGAAPDTLKDGGQAVGEGSLGSDGVFHADHLFARCPSKFEAKTPGA